VSVDHWRAGLRAVILSALRTLVPSCQSITGALACAPAALAAPYFSESCAGFYERNPDAQTNCKPVPHSARVKSFK
jgi:hypothetical protein